VAVARAKFKAFLSSGAALGYRRFIDSNWDALWVLYQEESDVLSVLTRFYQKQPFDVGCTEVIVRAWVLPSYQWRQCVDKVLGVSAAALRLRAHLGSRVSSRHDVGDSSAPPFVQLFLGSVLGVNRGPMERRKEIDKSYGRLRELVSMVQAVDLVYRARFGVDKLMLSTGLTFGHFDGSEDKRPVVFVSGDSEQKGPFVELKQMGEGEQFVVDLSVLPSDTTDVKEAIKLALQLAVLDSKLRAFKKVGELVDGMGDLSDVGTRRLLGLFSLDGVLGEIAIVHEKPQHIWLDGRVVELPENYAALDSFVYVVQVTDESGVCYLPKLFLGDAFFGGSGTAMGKILIRRFWELLGLIIKSCGEDGRVLAPIEVYEAYRRYELGYSKWTVALSVVFENFEWLKQFDWSKAYLDVPQWVRMVAKPLGGSLLDPRLREDDGNCTVGKILRLIVGAKSFDKLNALKGLRCDEYGEIDGYVCRLNAANDRSAGKIAGDLNGLLGAGFVKCHGKYLLPFNKGEGLKDFVSRVNSVNRVNGEGEIKIGDCAVFGNNMGYGGNDRPMAKVVLIAENGVAVNVGCFLNWAEMRFGPGDYIYVSEMGGEQEHRTCYERVLLGLEDERVKDKKVIMFDYDGTLVPEDDGKGKLPSDGGRALQAVVKSELTKLLDAGKHVVISTFQDEPPNTTNHLYS